MAEALHQRLGAVLAHRRGLAARLGRDDHLDGAGAFAAHGTGDEVGGGEVRHVVSGSGERKSQSEGLKSSEVRRCRGAAVRVPPPWRRSALRGSAPSPWRRHGGLVLADHRSGGRSRGGRAGRREPDPRRPSVGHRRAGGAPGRVLALGGARAGPGLRVWVPADRRSVTRRCALGPARPRRGRAAGHRAGGARVVAAARVRRARRRARDPGPQPVLAPVAAARAGARPRGGRRPRIDLDGAVAYAEKNWSNGGFPASWWWGQAHGFGDADVCVAFAGGRAGPRRACA